MNTSTKQLLQKQQPSSSGSSSVPSVSEDPVLRAEEAANRHFALAKAYFDPLGKALDRAAAIATQEALAEKELRRNTLSSSSSHSTKGLVLNTSLRVSTQ
ncbi:UNVERIFIED_CONTAM: hypothetical protein HDU68_000571 [Siphonaria sp. JEL0065]|nr:hypothetical protein HDU68_000571 [Siphonaria sp. JEL0065]